MLSREGKSIILMLKRNRNIWVSMFVCRHIIRNSRYDCAEIFTKNISWSEEEFKPNLLLIWQWRSISNTQKKHIKCSSFKVINLHNCSCKAISHFALVGQYGWSKCPWFGTIQKFSVNHILQGLATKIEYFLMSLTLYLTI